MKLIYAMMGKNSQHRGVVLVKGNFAGVFIPLKDNVLSKLCSNCIRVVLVAPQ